MSVSENKPVGDKRKKQIIGIICLAAVAVSAFSLVREMPHSPGAVIAPGGNSWGGGVPGRGGAPGGRQMPGTRGQITTVSANAITIQPRDGVAKTFVLTAATKITVDQNPVEAADLKAGQRARVVSTDDKSAAEVHVRTRPPGGRGGYPGGGTPAGVAAVS